MLGGGVNLTGPAPCLLYIKTFRRVLLDFNARRDGSAPLRSLVLLSGPGESSRTGLKRFWKGGCSGRN